MTEQKEFSFGVGSRSLMQGSKPCRSDLQAAVARPDLHVGCRADRPSGTLVHNRKCDFVRLAIHIVDVGFRRPDVAMFWLITCKKAKQLIRSGIGQARRMVRRQRLEPNPFSLENERDYPGVFGH